jgi:phosphate:Na+ symporter
VSGDWVGALEAGSQLLGGLALLLAGMHMVREAFQEGAVVRLRVLLQVLSRRRLLAVVAGVVITVVLSSSATAGMVLVSLVDAGVLSLPQALAVMLGNAIGTTLTVQFLAFRLREWSYVILAVGFFIRLLARYTRTRQVGSMLFGIGLAFLGVKVLSQAMSPVIGRIGVPAVERLATSTGAGFLLVLVAAAGLTALLMNSAAVIVLAFGLAEAGLPLRGLLPIVFGANIGTCASELLAGAMSSRRGRQLALGHLVFKTVGVLLFLPFVGPFARVVEAVTAWVGPAGGGAARAVANAHTLFNLANTAIFLPIVGWLALAMRRLIPEAARPPRGTLEHVDYRLLARPELALEGVYQEVVRMGELTYESWKKFLVALEEEDTRLLDDIERRDDLVDLLDELLTEYLARIPDEGLAGAREAGAALAIKHRLLVVIKDWEHVGDILSKELVRLVRKSVARGMSFAVTEQAELRRLGGEVGDSFVRTLEFLAARDPLAGDAVLARERRLDTEAEELYHRHLEWLGRGVSASRQSSADFTDLVGLMRSVHGYLAGVVRVLEGWRAGEGSGGPEDRGPFWAERLRPAPRTPAPGGEDGAAPPPPGPEGSGRGPGGGAGDRPRD